MDITLIVNVASVLAAGLAAFFAWRQAREARLSREGAAESARLAQDSTDAAVRSAAALERQALLAEEQSRTDPWTASWVRGDTYRITNSSGELLSVERTEVGPEEGARQITFTTTTSGEFDVGDPIEFLKSRAFGAQARKITVYWRYASDPQDSYRRSVFGV